MSETWRGGEVEMGDGERGATVKVVRILEALAASEQPQSLGVIANAASLHKSSAHRILATLVDMDVAERLAHGSYRFGTRFTVMAGAARDLLSDPTVSALIRLRTISNRATVLAFKSSDYARVIVSIGISSTAPREHLVAHVGTRTPLHTSAIGRCLLSGLPAWEIGAYFHRASLPSRPNPPTHLPDLLDEVKQIRKLGYAVECKSSANRGIAVPVLNAARIPIAAVGLVGAATFGGSDDPTHDLANLRCAAETIAAALLGTGQDILNRLGPLHE